MVADICGQRVTRDSFSLPVGASWVELESDAAPQRHLRCLRYRKKLTLAEEHHHFATAQNAAFTLTALDDVLPCSTSSKPVARHVEFDLPPNFRVSLPGEAIGTKRFVLAERPCHWSSGMVWGNIHKHMLTVASGKAHVALPETLSAAQQGKLLNWLQTGLKALSLTYGRLPVPEFQVLIIPVGTNTEAVPWGEVTRGGGDAVHLYVDETRTLEELNDDWVLVHELSHLLHPYLASSDAWLSEGIASYYQNVLRARSGLLSPQQAWEKLDAGFKRGETQFDPGSRLLENTRQLMRERQYMRVYWSGAAIALLADLELRHKSHGALSLDKLLEQTAACCLPTGARKWRAKALFEQFDKMSGSKIFSHLYDRYVMQAKFPVLANAYTRLGLTRTANGLQLSSTGATLRRAIMGN